MPALNTSLLTESSALASSVPSGNSTADALKVVCAWPLSGQYGPGSRVLYYVLIATCLLARRVEWLINACLAVALLFPAVAALHGIVLAAVHVEGAVDMDVFGSFQLCSIGILAAPVTVMLSKTFFNDPGRNIIFLWALLILVGLMSLAVEFYRIQTVECPLDDFAGTTSVPPQPADFPYDQHVTCGLKCSVDQAPKSPMRGGSADNVYVIPAPSILTFGTMTLLTAACCLHAILCLVSMWSKVMEIHWKEHFGSDDQGPPEERIAGANGVTKQNMKNINGAIRHFLSMVAIPVFGGAGIAIIIVGEINFFSKPVSYQTEPMASIGQWAPIVGTGLALLGSLYLMVAEDAKAVTHDEKSGACNCAHNHDVSSLHSRSHSASNDRGSRRQVCSRGSTGDTERGTPGGPQASEDVMSSENGSVMRRESNAGRHKVAQFLNRMGDILGSPPKSFVRDEDLREEKAFNFPEIPAEPLRDKNLAERRARYDTMVDHSHSRAASVRDVSPSTGGVSRSPSPKPRASTLPTSQASSGRWNHVIESEESEARGETTQALGGSLKVPQPVSYASGEPPASHTHTPSPVNRTKRGVSLPAMSPYRRDNHQTSAR